MKRLTLLLIMALSQAGTARAQPAGPSQNLPPILPPAKANQITITPDEWQELRAARSAAIRANPELIADNKKLLERMNALEEKIDAAMVKTDSSIAPIIARFEAGRQRPAMTAASTSSSSPPGK